LEPAVNNTAENSRIARQPDVSHFDKLPDKALIAVKALAAVLDKGISTVWRNTHTDPDFPQPIRLSAGCTRFMVGDIRAYLAKKVAASAAPKRHQRTKGQVAK
jgi:predicted DNA-binding transcriptional regulator AlpA